MKNTIGKFLAYHAWANAELLEKLALLQVPGREDSMHTALRLLNHTLVVARIFAAHLTGGKHDYAFDNTEDTPALADLQASIMESGRWYLGYIESIEEHELARCVSFSFTDGDRGCMTKAEMLLHVISHAGYHRGEVGRLLWQASITPPWDTFAVYLHQAEPDRRHRD